MKILICGHSGYEAIKKFLKNQDLDVPMLYAFDNIDFNKVIETKNYKKDIEDLTTNILLYNKKDNFFICKWYNNYNPYGREFYVYRVVEVDISRPWTLKEYDGSYTVSYLDDMELINKDLNYYEYKT